MVYRFLPVLFFIAVLGCANTERTWQLPSGVKSLRVNGYDMAYAERGSGVPIVMVHGALSDFRYFAAVMETLAEKNRVIAVSLRHFYPEPWDGRGGSFSYRQHAEDVAAFIRALGVGPVHLFGHSRGGSVALYAARAHPELLRTLTIGEGGSGIPFFAAVDATAGAAANRNRERSLKALALFDQGKVEDGLSFFVNDVSGPGAWDAATEPNRLMFRSNAWTIKGTSEEVADPYECADLRRVRAPIMIMLGESTSALFKNVSAAIHACVPQSERSVIPKASHAFPRQRPKEFAAALLTFVSRH